MAEDIVYTSVSYLGFEELRCAVSRAFPAEPDLQVADGDLYFENRFRELPQLGRSARVGRVRVTGITNDVGALNAEFLHLVTRLGPLLKWKRSVGANVVFEWEGFRQTPSKGATVGLRLAEQGVITFSIGVGSLGKGRESRLARRRVMEQIAESGLLPITVVNAEKGFRIEPTGDATLRLRSAGLRDLDPGGFSLTMGGSVSRRGLEGVGLSCQTLWERTCLPRGMGRHNCDLRGGPGGPRLLSRHRRRGFQGEAFGVLWAVLRAKTPTELEAARALCEGSASIECEVGSIRIDDENHAAVEIIASENGYKIQLVSRYPLDLEKMSARLGVDLMESGVG